MKIRRTANAGVLLQLDDVSFLLDGVCREVDPYPATPPQIRSALANSPADVLGFTHSHLDHYDPDFAADYLQAGGVIFGPEDIPGALPEERLTVGGVTITAIPSRHIGKAGGVAHNSFILEGSRCVWFVGDAAPLQWKETGLKKPDVLIAPYAYANSRLGWEITKQLTDRLVLLHLPEQGKDPFGLWEQVQTCITGDPSVKVYIPKIGEELAL